MSNLRCMKLSISRRVKKSEKDFSIKKGQKKVPPKGGTQINLATTYFPSFNTSIICATGLNFSVRYGKR